MRHTALAFAFAFLSGACLDADGPGNQHPWPARGSDVYLRCHYTLVDRSRLLQSVWGIEAGAASPSQRSAEEGAAPPECLLAPRGIRGAEAKNPYRRRILPILVVPEDVPLADRDRTIRAAGDRIAQSLARVQRWMGRQSGGSSFHFDRVAVLEANRPESSFACLGDASCSSEQLSHRVAGLVRDHGYPLFSHERHQLVFVLGAGSLLTTYQRDDAGGSTALVGDAVLSRLAEPCYLSDVESDAASCPEKLGAADWALVQQVLLLVGARGQDGVLGQRPLVGDYREDAPGGFDLSPAQEERIRSSLHMQGGALTAGTIHLADDDDYVSDVAVGAFDEGGDSENHTALVVWHRPTGLRTDANCHPPGSGGTHCDDAVGWQHTQFMSALVRFTSEGEGVASTVEAPQVVSEPVRPTGYARRVDEGAALAHDSLRDEYQVVWFRREDLGTPDEPEIHTRIMGRRIDASTGAAIGPEQQLRDVVAGTGQLDIVFDASTDAFLVTWSGHSDGIGIHGEPVRGAMLEGDGAVLGEAVTLSESGKFVRAALDPGRHRFLLTWNQVGGNGGPDVFGHFVTIEDGSIELLAPDGTRVQSPTPLIVEDTGSWNGLAEPAFDSFNQRWEVAYWHNGELGDWDVLSRSIHGGSGEILGGPALIAAGPSRYQYDPSLVFVPAAGRFLVSMGDDDGDFFDDLGYVHAQWMQPGGQPFSNRLLLHQQYDAYSRTESAAHPSWNLAVTAWSGRHGVNLELIQQDLTDYHETCVDESGGVLQAAEGSLSGLHIEVPPAVVEPGPCKRIYVDASADVVPTHGSCQRLGSSFHLGAYEPFPATESLMVRPPLDTSLGMGELDRVATTVVCRDDRTGDLSIEELHIDGPDDAWFELRHSATCQVMRCQDAADRWQEIEGLASSHDLEASCQVLEEEGFVGHHENDDLDFRQTYFVHSVFGNLQWDMDLWGTVVNNNYQGAYHRVWNLWNHQFADYSSLGLSVFKRPGYFGLGAYSGLAWGDNHIHSTFLGKRQLALTLTHSLPIPFLQVGGRLFYMAPLTTTFGVQLGIEAKASVSPVGGTLLDIMDVGLSREWAKVPGRRGLQHRMEVDNPLLEESFGVSPLATMEGGGNKYVEYGADGDYSYRERGEMVGKSIIKATLGIDPVAHAAARLAVGLGIIRDENERYYVYNSIQSIDEVCECELEDCPVNVSYSVDGVEQGSRDIDILMGETRYVFSNIPEGAGFRKAKGCRMTLNGLQAFVNHYSLPPQKYGE